MAGIFQIIVLIYSVVLHEVAHGVAARSLGDPTAERMGRLTLNPLKHLDFFGSFILPLLSFMVGGFMVGYAKPVPYDPNNLHSKRWGPALVGIAGPASNILLAVLFGLIIRFFGEGLPPVAVELAGYVVWLNIALAVFNLMPIPPLDGHWLLNALLPMRWYRFRSILYQYQWVLLAVGILFVFPSILGPIVGKLFAVLTGVRLI